MNLVSSYSLPRPTASNRCFRVLLGSIWPDVTWISLVWPKKNACLIALSSSPSFLTGLYLVVVACFAHVASFHLIWLMTFALWLVLSSWMIKTLICFEIVVVIKVQSSHSKLRCPWNPSWWSILWSLPVFRHRRVSTGLYLRRCSSGCSWPSQP